jgi:hypothetical protein
MHLWGREEIASHIEWKKNVTEKPRNYKTTERIYGMQIAVAIDYP